MKRIRIGFILLVTLLHHAVLAQDCDLIILQDGSEIEAKVLEVSSENISYKKCNFQDGPTYVVVRKDIFLIKYKDGTKELMSDAKVINNTTNNSVSATQGKPNQTAKYAKLGDVPINDECIKIYRRLNNGTDKIYDVLITEHTKKSLHFKFCDKQDGYYIFNNSIYKIEDTNGNLLFDKYKKR